MHRRTIYRLAFIILLSVSAFFVWKHIEANYPADAPCSESR